MKRACSQNTNKDEDTKCEFPPTVKIQNHLRIKILTLLTCIILLFGYPMQVKSSGFAEPNMTLTAKEQSIAHISALTAKGDLTQLKVAINKGLNVGLTINDIKEVMVHLYAYCGFPRSIRGLQTFIAVLDERKANGVSDEWGASASPITDNRTKYERGKEILEQLTGTTQDGSKTGYSAFSPEIEVFLKEHLFADIFERDVLTYQQRELVTVSALISIGGAEPMLSSHMNICLHQGITPNQLEQLIDILKKNVDRINIEAARDVLNELLERNNISIKNSIWETEKPDEIVESNMMVRKELVFPKGEKITKSNFVGTVWLSSLITADSINQNEVGSVTFEPGARTNWHLHPAGQIILAISGEGYYQEKGSPKIILSKGDVVKCPVNIPHWHGASPDKEFVQVAITGRQNGPTEWLKHVTDEEYFADEK